MPPPRPSHSPPISPATIALLIYPCGRDLCCSAGRPSFTVSQGVLSTPSTSYWQPVQILTLPPGATVTLRRRLILCLCLRCEEATRTAAVIQCLWRSSWMPGLTSTVQ